MPHVIIAIQFVCGSNGQYFVKELAVLPFESTLPVVHHFAPPYPYQELHPKARRQNDFDVTNINGLRWCDGDVDYNRLPEILAEFNETTIYVKGAIKESFLKKYLPNVNVIQLEIPKLRELKNFKTTCRIHDPLPTTRCAAQNCINLYMYYLMNNMYY